MKVSFILTFLNLVFISNYSCGQQFHLFKLNRTKHGVRHGLWVSYADSNNTVLEWKGRFKKGNEKGIWKYYYANGIIRKREIYCHEKIKTTNFNENGKIQSLGYAKLENVGNKLHYYYYGPWKYYSENGKLEKIVYYEKGGSVKEEKVK